MRVATSKTGYEPDELVVTPAMIGAGLRVLEESGLVDDLLEADESLVAQIYRAMRSKIVQSNRP